VHKIALATDGSRFTDPRLDLGENPSLDFGEETGKRKNRKRNGGTKKWTKRTRKGKKERNDERK